jgi:uncharacterized protein (DUF1697 family)
MRLVAFLRAINVGGHVVRMEDLRRIFVESGQSNVETFIASGNVVFESKSRSVSALTRTLEQALLKALKYEVATFIRPMAEVARIASRQPFGKPTGTLFVGFLSEPASQEKLQRLITPIDQFHIEGSEIYWHRLDRESEITGGTIEKVLGLRATLRNMNTIQRIAAKYGV